jgi:AcrR family transcriptional regulator
MPHRVSRKGFPWRRWARAACRVRGSRGRRREASAVRRRVPGAQRRKELIDGAVHEFAHGGLHGTTVDRIARRVGVAQPYVFSLFANKRELFLAALERSFELVAQTFTTAAEDFRAGRAPDDCADALEAMGMAYRQLLSSDRDYLTLQHQSYAACDDEVVRTRVRHRYALLVDLAGRLSGADAERLDDFFRYGMALNVGAALGVDDLSGQCDWVRAELSYDDLASDVRSANTDAGQQGATAG